ncbi:hypothetical protein J3459_018346 [Metarhizium acridum]|nr:hypothetical protein J3459_018346 [Metarhizium acridum]
MAGLPVIVGTSDEVGKLLFRDMRREGTGAVRPAGFPAILKHKTSKPEGNIKSIPPYTLNGKKYPAGRIVIGATDAQTPQALVYLQAQETQDPISLDTTWLFVKHVNEVLGFLPAKTPRGWRVAILDPMMGYEALSKLIKMVMATAEKVMQTLNILKKETGISDEDVVRIPAVIATMSSLKKAATCSGERGLKQRW